MTGLHEPAVGTTDGGPGTTVPVIAPTSAPTDAPVTEVPDTPDTSAWGGRHVHDPTIVRDDDGVYWCFCTDARYDGPVRGGVPVRRSADLVSWELVGWALDGVPGPAAAWSGAVGLWAPEVVRAPHGDGWRMYYSASSFGSRRSAIGLATAPHPGGPWTDAGLVVSSTHHEPPAGTGHPNAIDANVVADGDRQWLVVGSFFGGIHVLPLDPVTGLVAAQDALSAVPGGLTEHPGTLISRRAPHVDNGAVEGAFVLPRPGGGWALLVSYDSLASGYHVRAAVAPEVTGPYRDLAGHVMTDLEAEPWSVGVPVLSGHRHVGGPGLLAPGHGSVLTEELPDGGTRHTFVHHVRDADAPTEHRLQVRRLVWTHDGWPLVSPQPWAGTGREVDDEATWPADPAVLAGRWEHWAPGADPTRVQTTTVGELDPRECVRALGRGRFTWLDRDGSEVAAVVHPGWDAVRERATLVLTAVDRTGHVVLATKVDEGE